MHRAEAARIVEAQHVAILEQPLEVIVLQPRCLLRQHSQVARHAEVQHQRAAIVEMKQQVLGAPADALEASTLEPLRQICGDCPPESGFVHAEQAHASSHHVRLNAPTGGFDFG